MSRSIAAALPFASLCVALAACTSSSSSPTPSVRDAGQAEAGEDPVVKELWKRTRVALGIGQCQNLVGNEQSLVSAAVKGRGNEVRKCFEDVIRKRGCRTNGVPSAFDAMLMIDGDGIVQDLRIVPNKNDLPHECHGAVMCVQDAIRGLQVPDLSRFDGMRQAYMTVTLLMPDEADVRAEVGADGGAEEAAP